jgi:hypothetical protein
VSQQNADCWRWLHWVTNRLIVTQCNICASMCASQAADLPPRQPGQRKSPPTKQTSLDRASHIPSTKTAWTRGGTSHQPNQPGQSKSSSIHQDSLDKGRQEIRLLQRQSLAAWKLTHDESSRNCHRRPAIKPTGFQYELASQAAVQSLHGDTGVARSSTHMPATGLRTI